MSGQIRFVETSRAGGGRQERAEPIAALAHRPGPSLVCSSLRIVLASRFQPRP